MSASEKRAFNLPVDHTAFIDAKAASGEFESADEVVTEGLRLLQDHDASIERWLREKVAPTYDEMQAHPERAVSGDQWLTMLLGCMAGAPGRRSETANCRVRVAI